MDGWMDGWMDGGGTSGLEAEGREVRRVCAIVLMLGACTLI